MKTVLAEFAVSAGASTAICAGADTSPLLTALITFGVSIITMVGGELIKYLVAYFKNKTKKLELEEKKLEKEEDKDNVNN